MADTPDTSPESPIDSADTRTGQTRPVPLRTFWSRGSVSIASAIPDRFRSTSLGVGRSPVPPELTSISGPKVTTGR